MERQSGEVERPGKGDTGRSGREAAAKHPRCRLRRRPQDGAPRAVKFAPAESIPWSDRRLRSQARHARKIAGDTRRPNTLIQGVRTGCQHGSTILGRHDFVIVVRQWRQRGPLRRHGAWTPVGVADDRELAEAMADVLREEGDVDARAVSAYDLLHKIGQDDRERILERLNSRTTGDIERDFMLREAARRRLARYERRSGRDRRSGHDRRSGRGPVPPGADRRSSADRRSGLERRGLSTAAAQ